MGGRTRWLGEVRFVDFFAPVVGVRLFFEEFFETGIFELVKLAESGMR